jgi:hypothetical protein
LKLLQQFTKTQLQHDEFSNNIKESVEMFNNLYVEMSKQNTKNFKNDEEYSQSLYNFRHYNIIMI